MISSSATLRDGLRRQAKVQVDLLARVRIVWMDYDGAWMISPDWTIVTADTGRSGMETAYRA